jgi:hypothetical protein
VAGVVFALAVAAPAAAGPGDGAENTDDGWAAHVGRISVTGDVDPGLQASVPMPPPLCWWEPLSWVGVDPSDPEAVERYWNEELRPYLTGHAAEGALVVYENRFKEAIEAKKNGQDVTWYRLEYDESQLDGGDAYGTAAQLDAAGCGRGTRPGRYGPILVTTDWFVTGTQPAPVVDPEVLAEYAYRVMDLVDPTLEWNPTIKAAGDATLVNLATWLWVEQAAAVRERSVTASLGDVWATVTATTDGISITSPAGTTECSSEQAETEYGPGVDEGSACVLHFNRPSTGYPSGFPVDATSTWNATWTSSSGEGGELESRSAGATTYIPVIESGSTVTEVD